MPIFDESVPYFLCETIRSSIIASLLIDDLPVREGVGEALHRLVVELLLHLLVDSNGQVVPFLQTEILKISQYINW